MHLEDLVLHDAEKDVHEGDNGSCRVTRVRGGQSVAGRVLEQTDEATKELVRRLPVPTEYYACRQSYRRTRGFTIRQR